MASCRSTARPSSIGPSASGASRSTLRMLVGRQERVEQRVLAGEVVVEGAFADADRGGDVAEAGAEKALFGEEVERRVQDGLAGALPVGVPGACHKKLMVVHLVVFVKPGRRRAARAGGPPARPIDRT